MATARVRRSYDHRFRRLVQETGNVKLALWSGVPRSTARDWSRLSARDVVTLDVACATEDALRKEVVALQERNAKLSAVLRLVIVLLRVTGLTLARRRVADGAKKRRLIHAVERARKSIPLRTALRILGLSSTRYHAWRREEECELNDSSSCPRSCPHQLTSEEREAIKEMVCSRDFRHVPTGTLAVLAQRLGRVFAAPSTWYRLVRRHGWRRPRSRVHPERPKLGIRASGPDRIWHIDTTMVRLLDGTRTYVHAGVENRTTAVDELVDSGLLRRVLAHTEINYSNSVIEAWWRTLKHQWLYLNTLDTVASLRRLVAFYVKEHNARLPHSAFRGQTPDEVYFGTGTNVPDMLRAKQRLALAARLETNRTVTCGRCKSEVEG